MTTINQPRKIIHCDCDCFYAAIEIRDRPELAGRSVAVGGPPDRRGVIATCNYEARAFGVHSAMASSQAMRLCPQLIILPPDFSRYREASRQILDIYYDYTDLVEPLSLDEAYLDVSQAMHCRGSASLMATEIRQRIQQQVGITASAGVAPNKFIAKVASDWKKPNGQFVVRPEDVDVFVAALPVKKIFGVGKVTAARLHELGIDHCAQLRQFELVELIRLFGKFGGALYRLARGIDERPVSVARQRKSLSVETTFDEDLRHEQDCSKALQVLMESFYQRYHKRTDLPLVDKLFVKIRFADFSATTVERRQSEDWPAEWLTLLGEGLRRRPQAVRLLGLGVRFAEQTESGEQQLNLF